MSWYSSLKLAWQRTPESPYGPQRLPVTSDSIQAMQQTVSAWVDAGLLPAPTDTQWQMILCDQPSACVRAAAGSGKSTTLVLRIIFMVHFLGIASETITVFSFTRASCADLRQSLERWSVQLGLPTPWQQVVSTFHSRLVQLMQREGAYSYFELLGRSTAASESSYPTLFASSHLSQAQHELLNQAFAACYREHAQFRQYVGDLLYLQTIPWRRVALKQKPSMAASTLIKQAARADLSLCQQSRIDLTSMQLWPAGLKTSADAHFKVDGYTFHAHGRLNHGDLVFLDGIATEIDPINRTSWDIRADLIAHRCLQPYIYVHNRHELELLQQLLHNESDNTEGSSPLPVPQCYMTMAGESFSLSLQEIMLQTADFMACLGLDPGTSEPPATLQDQERLVWRATQIFWPDFQQYLHEKHGIKTFHEAFRNSASSPCMQHVLIDEFQDISAQIVNWILSCQRQLSLPCSIMAIGDDWQSIYAWRGASPQFLLDFHQHFPVHRALNKPTQLTLNENFRCVAPIVMDAGRLLEPVSFRAQHQVVAARPSMPDDHGIHHYGLHDDFFTSIISLIREQLQMDRPELIVLARKKQDLAEIRKRLPNSLLKCVNLQTLHGGKGLQATVAIIVGDCLLGKPHPLRDAIYQKAGMRQSYSHALRDEAYRLAYVGVTRGMRRVFWVSRQTDSRAQGVVKHLSRYHPPQLSFTRQQPKPE